MDRSVDNGAEARAALERFVVENDDLLELEERIGRFNIFDALGIARAEIRHSNFLAWLLDPNESHGQGSLFLKAVLMDLLKQTPAEMRPLSPIELDGEELRGVEVRREWRSIDILITCKHPAFVVAIENKIDSGEHADQLDRYKTTLAKEFPGSRCLFVYLTVDGTAATSTAWGSYSYGCIHAALSRAVQTCGGLIGKDVGLFLDHYLRLLRGRIMSDPEIDSLCRRIYSSHRQAIDTIIERMKVGPMAALDALEKMLGSRNDWIVAKREKKYLNITHRMLDASLPPWGTRSDYGPRQWLVAAFGAHESQFGFGWWLDGPAPPKDIFADLVRALTAQPGAVFSLPPTKRALKRGDQPEGWSLIHFQSLCSSEDPQDAELHELVNRASEELKRWEIRMPELVGCIQTACRRHLPDADGY